MSPGRSAMKLSDLRYAAAAADIGNFTRAAKALGLHSSTLSRRVGHFEDELGIPLFERGHAGVRLTAGGEAVMVHVRRALAELDAISNAGRQTGSGGAGEVRLGIRMPPVGEPVRSLLLDWRKSHPDIGLTLTELNDGDLPMLLEQRQVDVALIPGYMMWPHAAGITLYNERIMVAVPDEHALIKRQTVRWRHIAAETFLVQGWGDNQAQRAFYTSLVGSTAKFQAHDSSKQSILALVGAGYGITLATRSQAEASFPGVVFCPVRESNASVHVDLVWMPEIEEPAIGRFVAFMRDAARLRGFI